MRNMRDEFQGLQNKSQNTNCNFNGNVQKHVTPVRIEAQEIRQRESFQYVGSIISKDGEIDEDVEKKIKSDG